MEQLNECKELTAAVKHLNHCKKEYDDKLKQVALFETECNNLRQHWMDAREQVKKLLENNI